MTFPSLQNLLQSIQYVLKRFPLEIFFAVTGTIAAICQSEIPSADYTTETWYMRILMVANIGLLFSLSATFFLETREIKGTGFWVSKFAIAMLAISLIFFIDPLNDKSDTVRFFLLSLSAHLLVAFSAFLRPGFIQGFWQLNKTLFLRLLTGILYSAVLYLGLIAALYAIKFLFGIQYGPNTFFILWICITGIFNTIFFLAGIPKQLLALDHDFNYPKGLKVFTQYVLIPLASVYVIILLAYEAKILVLWNLPKGYVSNIILGYAVFGILSLLLVFPIREQEENKWIKTYARSFYFLMLPLLVLLFLAVGTRISHYGVTEYRYFLILLAFWLLFITVYFLVSAKQNIKLIPISLCILTFLSVYGPQSAFSISSYSQKRILINIFIRHHAFKNNKLVPIKKIAEEEANQAIGTLKYIVDHDELSTLQPYINKDLKQVNDSLVKIKSRYGNISTDQYELQKRKMEWLQNYVGLNNYRMNTTENIFDKDPNSPFTNYSIMARENEVVNIQGYDFMLETNGYSNMEKNYLAEHTHIKTNCKNQGELTIALDQDSVTFDLKQPLDNLLKDRDKLKSFKNPKKSTYDYQFPHSMLSFSKQSKNFDITFQLNSIRFFTAVNGKVKDITNFEGVFLIKKNAH